MASVLLWYLLAALTTTPTDATALRSSSPADLTESSAWIHLVCARAAGASFGIDPDVLLSIAWHESRYRAETATPLSPISTRHSCGVMTPEPVDRATCARQTASVISGYIAGASHVAVWLRAEHGDLSRALGGVAGGYHFLRACAVDPTPVCRTPAVFLERARRIKALRDRAHHALS